MPAAIETEQLTKSFGPVVALDGVDLRVEMGEIFGFLGPNGAGKTTTVRLILDLIRPTSGRAAVLGFDCQAQSLEVRRRVGYLPGELRLYDGLTGTESVELYARLRGEPPDQGYVDGLARRLSLDLGKKAAALSKGNRQKLGLLLALLGRPPLLLLDEPTSGLDPVVQHEVWGLLRDEADRGATVFFSSHVMSEVEQICERVAILGNGRLITVDSIASLKLRQLRHVEARFAEAAPPAAAFQLPGIRELSRDHDRVEFEVSGEVDALLKALARHHIIDIQAAQPTLDDILLSYYRQERSK